MDRQGDRRSDLSMFSCEAAVGLKPVWKLLNTHWLPKNGDSFWPKRVSCYENYDHLNEEVTYDYCNDS
jgi:hypothetical protein